jgi:hypothetical protein
MKWRCVLIQRWLPDYPDGDLSPFWRRRLVAHLQVCPDCQAELAELKEVVQTYQQHPLPAPEPGFWEEFNRELHQKLAQVNHQAPAPERRRLKLPYLLGAPALAVLLIFISSYLVNLHQPGKTPQLAERQKLEQPLEKAREPRLDVAKEQPSAPAPASEMGRFMEAEAERSLVLDQKFAANHALVPEQVIYAGLEDGLWQDELPSWDVEAVIADLSPQERKVLVENLSSRR